METLHTRKRPLNHLSNLYEKQSQPGRVSVYTFTNNFKLGEIDIHTSTFISSPRTSKNIFRTFKGLGLNAQLLAEYNFKFIEIPFENTTLKTIREKWLAEGIPSPYCNSLVDQQLILRLDRINLEPITKEVEQLEFF
jgi:hypothetical protein